MRLEPLPEFTAYRAKHRLSDYVEFVAPEDVVKKWEDETRQIGPFEPFPPIPPSARNAYEVFLEEEGRSSRRLIDVPDPAYSEGHDELNRLIDRVIASRHEPSLKSLVASIQVDLDWVATSRYELTQDIRTDRRLREGLERAIGALTNAEEPSTLLYRPSLRPITAAIRTVSDALVAHLARNPSALHELRPRQFEELIAHVLARFGWEVELTPETRDGGYDILAVSKDVDGSGLRTSYVIECKKYRPERKVGIAVARQILQVKSQRDASHAVIVTTSDFTSGVYDFAAERLDLDPRNAEAVIDWCKRHTLGGRR